jgi:hypothetical protein
LTKLTDVADTSSKLIASNDISLPRISIRGRQFRFIENGEEIAKQTDPINVVILGVVPENGMCRTFYIDGYQPGSTDPPDCSSWYGIKPDPWCNSPQSEICAKCPQAVWGSAVSMSGKKAKACKDSKRLMLINANDIKNTKSNIYIFNVTIASLKALSSYGRFLISNNLPMAAVITQIEFVDSEFPQVRFEFKGILSETLGLRMLERSSKKEWDWTESESTMIEAKPVPAIEAKPVPAIEAKPVPTVETDTETESIDDLLNNWSK